MNEARLLTLDEYAALGAQDSAVIEYRDPHDKPIGKLVRWPETYGKTWRAWTRRPTKKQAKAVEWDA